MLVCNGTKMQAAAHTQGTCIPLTYAFHALPQILKLIQFLLTGFPPDIQKQPITTPKSSKKPRVPGA